MIIISDIHGCYYTLLRLLDKCPSEEQLVFCGDLIDRGPHSRQVVEYAMQNEIPTCAGNHDDLCLAFYNRRAKCSRMYDPSVWLKNGGDEAAPNWSDYDPSLLTAQQRRMAERIGGRVPDSVLSWFESLPAYIIPDVAPDENGRKLLCSHTGYGIAADDGDWFSTLWGRHSEGDGEFPDDEYYRVFGHTVTKEAIVTEKWANIDSGAAYASRGAGTMTAFHWPSKQLITQPYDESPL